MHEDTPIEIISASAVWSTSVMGHCPFHVARCCELTQLSELCPPLMFKGHRVNLNDSKCYNAQL